MCRRKAWDRGYEAPGPLLSEAQEHPVKLLWTVPMLQGDILSISLHHANPPVLGARGKGSTLTKRAGPLWLVKTQEKHHRNRPEASCHKQKQHQRWAAILQVPEIPNCFLILLFDCSNVNGLVLFWFHVLLLFYLFLLFQPFNFFRRKLRWWCPIFSNVNFHAVNFFRALV